MSDILQRISSLSIAVPVLTAIARHRFFTRAYKPLFILLLVGLITEIFSVIFYSYPAYIGNCITNVYSLIEFQLLLWLFYRWEPKQKEYFYHFFSIGLLGAGVWYFDNIILSMLYGISEIVRIFNSFVICLLAINHINRLLITERKSILYNPAFIICCGFVLYFSYKILVEVFYMHTGGYFSPVLSADNPQQAPLVNLARNIYSIHDYVNTLFNFILTFAVLCLPRPPGFFSKPSL
jgi:hypothetical protein